MNEWQPTWPDTSKVKTKQMPIPDSKLTTIVELSERIISINKQVAEKEAIRNHQDWDKYNKAVIKLNGRKHVLWYRRAKLIKKNETDRIIF